MSFDLKHGTLPGDLVLFDGVCGLCHGFVQFLLKRDYQQRFFFLSLQSPLAEYLLGTPYTSRPDTIILIQNLNTPTQRHFFRSSAIIRILAQLGFPWFCLRILHLIPAFFRDLIYRAFATVRYRIFGRLSSCPIPSPQYQSRFLDS